MEVAARTAELVNEVMEDGSGGTTGGVEAGAAEAVERVDVEMILQELVRVLREEGVALIDEAVRQFTELGGLVVGDQQLRRGNAGKLIFQQPEIRELGDGELTGGVIDAGEAGGFSVAADGGEVVGALVVQQRVVIDGAWC